MTLNEMDEVSSMLSSVLHSKFKASAAVVIAPYLVSEKQQGYRGQLRTGLVANKPTCFFLITNCFTLKTGFIDMPDPCRAWESKFDAKSFFSQSIAVRCGAPPSKRRVPIQFDGWVLMWLG